MSDAPRLPLRVQAVGENPMRLIAAAGFSFAAALTDPQKLQRHKTAIIDLGSGTLDNQIYILLNELTKFFNEDRMLFTGYEFIETGNEDRIMISILGEKIQNNIHVLECGKLAPMERGNIDPAKKTEGRLILDFTLIPEE